MPTTAVGLAVPTVLDNTEASLLNRFPGELPYYLGRMNHVCMHCKALRWGQERTKENVRNREEKYMNCCQYGDLKLPMADFDGPPLPDDLFELFTSSSKDAKEFQQNITSYNNAMSFSSLGAKQDHSVMGQKGVGTFKISGQLSHKIPALFPTGDQPACYGQIFMLGDGGEKEVENRLAHFAEGKIKKRITRKLQDIMHRVNPYAEVFRNANEILASEDSMTIVLKSLAPGNRDAKTYNKPRPGDIAALVEEGSFIDAKPRHIKVSRKDGKIIYMTDLHTPYLSLRYPLLLPYGSQQWDDNYQSPTMGTNPGRK
ncbi:uncharacterized protein MELLADRAFT_58373 [Melampsora larici-populina 98AG31]|uniref:Helitron helicase-like domain-containing protein n=1 Tax=Melampsora larici-populina (strain 98AG31 / pathotype 3-4-7) TaxID=747676 RepID=F4R393_MELLP|nr:uncharacterized protein MELLADRAFT_58373 [Melampsora larici-populina 98AG31]EGG13209.1 hypothetical protein MELLADRAFT_58373 [Melampsora larici-populina 98AG31]